MVGQLQCIVLPSKDFVHDKFAKRFKILTFKKKKKKKHHWVLFDPALVSLGEVVGLPISRFMFGSRGISTISTR